MITNCLCEIDYCLEPKAEGNCTDVYATWFYDTPKKSCSPFYYTGCNGNLNNFPSKEACEAQCPPEIGKFKRQNILKPTHCFVMKIKN